MAGHSKWANIKHRKAAQDKKRGKLYTKIIREITVAARLGGGDVGDNPRLRAAVDKALSANMPKDTIDRAVQRGAGGAEGADVEELVYEGYGPGGVAILIEAMTDNRNRTVAEVRHAFSKANGNLGTDGSVAYLFTKQGIINFAPGADVVFHRTSVSLHHQPDDEVEIGSVLALVDDIRALLAPLTKHITVDAPFPTVPGHGCHMLQVFPGHQSQSIIKVGAAGAIAV